MSDTALRSGLIRLAFYNPELRADLLPLIEKEAAAKVHRNRSPGEVWKTPNNKYRAVSPSGVAKSFDTPDEAKAHAGKGGGGAAKSEKKDEGKKKIPSREEVNDTVEDVLVKTRDKYGPEEYAHNAVVSAEKALLDAFSDTNATQDDIDKAWGQTLKRIEAELKNEISSLENEAGDGEDEYSQSVQSAMEEWQDSLDLFSRAVADGNYKAPKVSGPKEPTKAKPTKPKFKGNYRPKMESVMKKHELTDDDAKQVMDFSVARPKKGKPQSPEELKRRFMQNAKPETKERMKNMSPADFMVMLRAVLDQEEGGGKTASLRAGLIRLAYANPSLRPTLLPLIQKHAEDAVLAQAKKAIEGLARLVAAKVGGTVGSVEGRTGDGYTRATAEVVVPNLPSITSGGDDDAVIEVEIAGNAVGTGESVIYFRYVLPQPRLKWLADKVANLSVRGNDIEDAVQKAAKSAQALPAVLEPMREREALRRNSSVAFKRAMPEMKEWLRKALIHSGFMGSVKVWGHPVGGSGAFTTEDGIPYAAESIVIEGLLTEDEGRDVQRSQEVLANTRKVLTKALSRFFSNGVAAKLSSKPAYWSSYTYNTTVILYFKDAPVGNMKLAGDEGDMAAVLEAEADPTSHDQNLPEHYYFGKTAEERLENIEKMLSQFASPKSKDQNKPQSYYGLPPKGKQASIKSASRPLGPGVHLIEDLSVLGPNFRLVFRELGGDFLGSEQVPGYYLDLGGLLKVVYKTPKMSPAGEAQAKKTIAKLLAMMKAGSTKTAGGSGAANAEYLRQSPLKNKILQAVAKHYGTTTSAIMSELTDPDAEAVFEYIGNDAALQMQVYRDFKSKGFRAASVKTAAGPDSTGRNWKKHKTTGINHWIWQGRPDDPIARFMVIENTAPFGKYYKMTVKLQDGTFLQTVGQKLKPSDWFKRAAQIYATSQTVSMLDFSDMPEKWSRLNGPAPV